MEQNNIEKKDVEDTLQGTSNLSSSSMYMYRGYSTTTIELAQPLTHLQEIALGYSNGIELPGIRKVLENVSYFLSSTPLQICYIIYCLEFAHFNMIENILSSGTATLNHHLKRLCYSSYIEQLDQPKTKNHQIYMNFLINLNKFTPKARVKMYILHKDIREFFDKNKELIEQEFQPKALEKLTKISNRFNAFKTSLPKSKTTVTVTNKEQIEAPNNEDLIPCSLCKRAVSKDVVRTIGKKYIDLKFCPECYNHNLSGCFKKAKELKENE